MKRSELARSMTPALSSDLFSILAEFLKNRYATITPLQKQTHSAQNTAHSSAQETLLSC
jgi:hypothetical protein